MKNEACEVPATNQILNPKSMFIRKKPPISSRDIFARKGFQRQRRFTPQSRVASNASAPSGYAPPPTAPTPTGLNPVGVRRGDRVLPPWGRKRFVFVSPGCARRASRPWALGLNAVGVEKKLRRRGIGMPGRHGIGECCHNGGRLRTAGIRTRPSLRPCLQRQRRFTPQPRVASDARAPWVRVPTTAPTPTGLNPVGVRRGDRVLPRWGRKRFVFVSPRCARRASRPWALGSNAVGVEERKVLPS